MAHYAIGDVQGCERPLRRLLDKLNFDPALDELWFCGDLVNRGGRSLEVLRLVYALRERSQVVLGNHDLHLLAYAHGSRRKHRDNPEFERILAAPDGPELLEWLQSCPLMVHDAAHKLLLVHAGLRPDWSLARALTLAAELEAALRGKRAAGFLKNFHRAAPRWDDRLTGRKRLRAIAAVLTRIRFCDAEGHPDYSDTGPPGSQGEGLYPWFETPGRRRLGVTVVFGHWAALGYYRADGLLALDSGCVWGGPLTAVDLEHPERPIQVPGVKT